MIFINKKTFKIQITGYNKDTVYNLLYFYINDTKGRYKFTANK